MSLSDAGPLIPRVAADVTVHDDGLVHITRPKWGPTGTRVLRLFRISPDLTLHLDEMGSFAWRLVDGRNVAAILDALQERYPEEQGMGLRLGKHLGALVENKFLVLEAADAV